MEMINGSLSPEDRLARARVLQEMANNFINLANVQDESGNYILPVPNVKSALLS